METARRQERKRRGEDTEWLKVTVEQWQDTAQLASIQAKMSAKSSHKAFSCSFKMVFALFIMNTFLSIPVDTFPK